MDYYKQRITYHLPNGKLETKVYSPVLQEALEKENKELKARLEKTEKVDYSEYLQNVVT